MSLYPSLEDLKVGQAIQAQTNYVATVPAVPAIDAVAAIPEEALSGGGLYPNIAELSDYMGMNLSSDEVQQNLALVPSAGNQVASVSGSSLSGIIAPVSGNSIGIRRAEIKQGIREVIFCKDQDGKVGLRLRSIDNGIFVQLVQANSPASLAGLRFGDQVLQIDGNNCAGWSSDKAHKVLKQASPNRISLIVRDRPFQRTVTMQKDSTGHVGFIYKNGKITSIVKGSSAARNGLLTDHNICEINGQNVIGLKDSQVSDILSTCGQTVTVTIIPSVIYEHMIKRMASGLIKSLMDHSVPEV
ncbi:syntenin-2 [Protopterus annectens]|uniref:syntenin-2 n=1 Tax=Protopterus annectens TaxID=7888 RepID=UPI001CFB23BD|nr:syntenin-2 [Protopterus annectens]